MFLIFVRPYVDTLVFNALDFFGLCFFITTQTSDIPVHCCICQEQLNNSYCILVLVALKLTSPSARVTQSLIVTLSE